MPRKSLVLGVDDNPRNLTILGKAIGSEFELLTAASGEEALEIAASRRPDLVLLDIMMGGIDGYETCRRLKAMPRLRNTKVILVSARAQTSERLEGYAAGADDYVVKPFDPDELLAKVRVYVRLKTVEEVESLKSDLLNLLGHETRTPLAAILTPLAMLLESGNLDEEQRDFLRMIEDGGQRLLSLVDKISYLCQLRGRAVPVTLQPWDIGQFVRSLCEARRAAASAAGVRLDVECHGEHLAQVDDNHLTWALQAVLANAIRFSPRGSTVTVRVESEAGDVRITVADQGSGVAPEHQARLFDAFFVGDVRHHQSGHGLSLAIAHDIADLHGGALRLVEQDGPGARFELRIPCLAARMAA